MKIRDIVLLLLLPLVIAFVFFTIYLWESYQRFSIEREAQRLAELAAITLDTPNANVESSALLAIRSLRIAYTPLADATLQHAMDRLHTRCIFRSPYVGLDTATFSPNGNYVFTVDQMGNEHVWDVETCAMVLEMAVMPRPTAKSPRGLFEYASPDERYVIHFSHDGQSIVVVDTFTQLSYWKSLPCLKSPFFTLAFSPDSRLVAFRIGGVGCEEALTILDLESGTIVHQLVASTYPQLTGVFSNDGHLFAISDSTSSMRIYDLISGDVQVIVEPSHSFSPRPQFSPNGEYLADIETNGIPVAYVWQRTNLNDEQVLLGHKSQINFIQFTSDNRYILTSSSDGTARLWYVNEIPRVQTVFAPGNDLRVTLHPSDNRLIAYGAFLNSSVIWEASGDEFDARVSDAFSEVSFGNNGQYLVTDGSGGTQIRDAQTLEYQRSIPGAWVLGPYDGIQNIAFLNDNLVLLLTLDGFRVFDVEAGRELTILENLHQELAYRQTTYTFNTELQSLAFIKWNESVLNVVGHGSTRWQYQIPLQTGALTFLAFTLNGERLIATSVDGKIWLVDLNVQPPIRLIRDIGLSLVPIDYAVYRNLLAVGVNSNVELIDVTTGRTIRTFYGHVRAISDIDITDDGRRIATAGRDGRVRLWDVDYRDFIDYACTRVFDDLDVQERERFNLRTADGRLDMSATCPSLP